MGTKKRNVNAELRRDVLHYYYHGKLDIQTIATKVEKSTRTIYRWIKDEKKPQEPCRHKNQIRGQRGRHYSEEILKRIIALKQENSRRSAAIIKSLLISEKYAEIPSDTTIRRYLRENGLGKVAAEARRGYVTFEREKPNELWQIDIAGVQSVAHLGQLYLFALLDDCSRFIVAAFYADTQQGFHVIRLLQQAITDHGRPLAIVADNGTQFRNVVKGLNSKYEKILKLLSIKSIFAKPNHPQTKGKLERFFGTVKTMFLSEARFQAKTHPEWTLSDFNHEFSKWKDFYNHKHRHRSLPGRCPPADVFLLHKDRIFRPLERRVDWKRWIMRTTTRKVSKTNFISYNGLQYQIPPGYAGLKVELHLFDRVIEIYRNQQCIVKIDISPASLIKRKAQTRRIAQNGRIGFGGNYYTIGYKLAGQQVEVKVTADGSELLIYAQGQLIRRLKK